MIEICFILLLGISFLIGIKALIIARTRLDLARTRLDLYNELYKLQKLQQEILLKKLKTPTPTNTTNSRQLCSHGGDRK